MSRVGRTLAVLAVAVLAHHQGAAAARPPVIAAASDLQFALPEIVAAFHQATGHDVTTTFGSSGNLYRQIQQGAPFELFFSADEEFALRLAREGKARDRGVVYATGRIGLFVPTGSPLEPDGTLADLRAAIDDGRVKRFALANPEHAPYGMRAREALRHAGLWDRLQPYLVLGENISQATQFAATGGAQGGIIAQSLATAPSVAALGRFALIPEGWHEPLRQRVVRLQGAGDVAEAFYRYVQQPASRKILRAYGFDAPSPGPAR